MANAELYIPKLKQREGGWANNPNDKGKCTMSGVTIGTFQSYYGTDKTCSDLKKITNEQWRNIFFKGYWNPCRADQIKSQSIAELVVDMAFMSGVKTTIKKIQTLFGLKADGIIGPITLNALNSGDLEKNFLKIKIMRAEWFLSISGGSNSGFYKPWMRRLLECKYEG